MDSWSRNNRYLLTASHDSTAIIWDLAYLTPLLPAKTPIDPGPSSSRRQTLRFDAPLTNAQFHPRNSGVVLVTLSSEVVLVDLRNGGGRWTLNHEEEQEQEQDEAMDDERRAKKGYAYSRDATSGPGSYRQVNIDICYLVAMRVSYICRIKPGRSGHL